MKGNRFLIDTSVWIDYFKGQDQLFLEKVDEILTYHSVYVPAVVIAELIQGAKSEKEISVIESFIDAFTIIDQTENTWLKAGRLSFSLKKRGLTVNLVDCYIAVLAVDNDCAIFSLDEHFKLIGKVIKIALIGR
jgi:predicted nucleic acid-binding protein